MAYSRSYPAYATARRPAYGYNASRRWATARPSYRYGTAYRWPSRGRYGYSASRFPYQHAGYRYTGIPRWSAARRWPWGYYGYAYTPPTSLYEPQAPAYAPEGAQPAGAQWIYWAQSCLGQTIGSWVPQSGRMGPRTRKAIRIFQTRQQLPATGLLDTTTVNALRLACSTQAASPAPAAPVADDAAAATAAASATPPPETAAQPPEAAPPEDAPAEEAVSSEWGWPVQRRFRQRNTTYNGDSAPSVRYGQRWPGYGRPS